MPISETTAGERALASRLLDVFKRRDSVDEAAQAVLEHQERVQRRIEAARKEVSRGIRSNEHRFHL